MTPLADLQGLIDRAARRHGVPGAAVAVGTGRQVVEAATGVVNVDTGVEATVDSVFQIGSVTKAWTAALVMQLAGEHLVDLDEPVRGYLPEFGVLDTAASASITARQLLSHTGGFDGDLLEDTGRGDDAVAKLVAFMRTNARQLTDPGTLFSYCNAGYCALGALVARRRGRTWEAAMRDLLIDPLGAGHMALYAEEAIMFRAAVGHVGKPPRPSPRRLLPQADAPAGSTLSAALRDLVRFGRMLLADGVADDGTRVLPTGTFAEMCRPQVTLPRIGDRPAAAWGLGLMLFDWDGRPVVGHDGSTPGTSTTWRIVPDRDLVFAIHANGGHLAAFIDDVLAEIISTTADIRLPPRLSPPPTPVPFHPDTYTGTYAAPRITYNVRADADGLAVTEIPSGLAAQFRPGKTTTRYVHVGDSHFVGLEPPQGPHPMIAFLQDGRFLYNLRLVPRVTD
ncbi:serine hydrolase domain-containing protein [Dactylosporangium sp. NPDC051541]|uniref:serine hydrolase domain-containing protein n=1 Tax=Dactylosporangium sp. NPDC051541 TaxID=3363977 RepID=UPI00378FCBE5